MPTARSLIERFPAVRRIGRIARPRRIPFIQQMEWTDCGAACLAMVLGYHGKAVELREVREALGVARDGVNARMLVEGGARFGLVGRGVKLEVARLGMLERGTILHWEMNHFVVLDRVLAGGGVRIVDPAVGIRDVDAAEVARAFTGVALELRPARGFTRQKGKGGQVHRYLREVFAERPLLARVVVVSLVLRLVGLVLPLLTGLVIDWVVPRSDVTMLWVTLAAVAAVVLFDAFGSLMRAQLLLHLRTILDARMTLGFLDHLVSLPIAFFQQRSAGDLMQRVSSNATVREIVTSQSLSAVIDGVFVLAYAAVICLFDLTLGVVAIALATAQVAIFMLARPRNQRLLAEDLEKQARAQSYLVQLLGGMETLKCAGAERLAVERWSNLYADTLNVSLRRGRLSAGVSSLRNGVSSAAPMVILALGARAVMAGHMTLGTMFAMSALAGGLFGPLAQLVGAALKLQLVKGYADRIDDVLRTPIEQDPEQVARPPELSGAISVRGVSFRYADSAPLVLDGIDLEVPAGAQVALVGPSGSGKSTLLALLAGMHRPGRGTVAYDGRPLGELDLAAVRRQIGVVTQHPFIFGATVRDNIALTQPGATLERVVRAARGAAIDDDVGAMPMAYDTQIADGGASLSGGQRQRIAIARAILGEPRVLLLDEATSALDTTTEARVIAHLDRLRCTRIVIAHRLSTVRRADLIVVLDRGRIVETGRHAELLARGGAYARLCAAGRPDAPLEARHDPRPASLRDPDRRAPGRVRPRPAAGAGA